MFGIDDLIMAGILTAGVAGASYYSSKQAAKQGFAMNRESWEYYQKQKELDYKYDSGKYLDLDKQYNEWYKQLEYDWKQKYAQNSAQWTVEGLKNAGLNPLLAASSGFTGSQLSSGPVTASRSSSGSALGHSADMHGNNDVGSTMSGLASSMATGTLLGAQKDKAEAEADVAEGTVQTKINTGKAEEELTREKIATEQAMQAKYAQDTAKGAVETKRLEQQVKDFEHSGGAETEWLADLNRFTSSNLEAIKNAAKPLTDRIGAAWRDLSSSPSPTVDQSGAHSKSPTAPKPNPASFLQRARRHKGILRSRKRRQGR